MEYLSNIELYYSSNKPLNGVLKLTGEEYYHAVKVMRHSHGEKIFITDGRGKIYEGNIKDISADSIVSDIIKTFNYENGKKNITFCLPRLKSTERFEFALEKSAELGITSFKVYSSSRTVSKGTRLERWNKILVNSMKQSLLSFLPLIADAGSLEDVLKLEGHKIVFDQSADKKFSKNFLNTEEKFFLIFGPEGGLTEEELKLFRPDKLLKLTENRLRTETAAVMCASLL